MLVAVVGRTADEESAGDREAKELFEVVKENAGDDVAVGAAGEADVSAEGTGDADLVAGTGVEAAAVVDARVAASVDADTDVPTDNGLAALLPVVAVGATEGLEIDPTTEDDAADVADLAEAPTDPSSGTVTTTPAPEGDATGVESVSDAGDEELDAPEVATVQPPTVEVSTPTRRAHTLTLARRRSAGLRHMPLSYTSTFAELR